MNLALVIIHIVISLCLVVVVLMQHGKQQGLSGAIAGGAETFFGKNKGRTIDAMLKKFTAVVAVLFVISSLLLTFIAVKDAQSKESAATETEQTETLPAEQQQAMPTQNENGDWVDDQGNVVMTKEDYEKAIQEQAAQAEQAPAENAEAPAENAETPAAEGAQAPTENANASNDSANAEQKPAQ